MWFEFLAAARRACPALDIIAIAGNHDSPARLGAAYPAVYEQLSGFFRQDPLGAPRSASIFAPERR